MQNSLGSRDRTGGHHFGGIAGQQFASQHWVSDKVAVDPHREGSAFYREHQVTASVFLATDCCLEIQPTAFNVMEHRNIGTTTDDA